MVAGSMSVIVTIAASRLSLQVKISTPAEALDATKVVGSAILATIELMAEEQSIKMNLSKLELFTTDAQVAVVATGSSHNWVAIELVAVA